MGASLGLAGLTACTRQPTETIMPYVVPPEEALPGIPLYYATAVPQPDGLLQGVLVETHLGRPTKVEGNPNHPASLGASSVSSQAAVLDLYDPDRSQNVATRGEISSWPQFRVTLSGLLDRHGASDGAGVRFLSHTLFSPSLIAQREEIIAAFPQARWVESEPAGSGAARLGAALAFGTAVHTYHRLDRANVLLAIDSDFLCTGSSASRYAHDFMEGRRMRDGNRRMNRLYAVEPTPSMTGGRADHRFTLNAAEIPAFAAQLAGSLGVSGYPVNSAGSSQAWFGPLVTDLKANQGTSAVLAGDWQPPEVHAIVQQINAALGNFGQTLIATDPLVARPWTVSPPSGNWLGEMNAGKVELLVIVGCNPVYDAPADLDFSASLKKVRTSVHFAQFDDETSLLCDWHIPEAHAFEHWGDGRAYDGTVTILQPLISPLFGGISPHEFLSAFTPRPARSSYQVVREYWSGQHTGSDFEDWWAQSVHDGVIAGSALPAKTITPKSRPVRIATGAPSRADTQNGLEIIFRPDPYIHDGRAANNAWLQELPRPFTKLTWDNAVLVAPATAQKLNLRNQQIVEMRHNGHAVSGSVYLNPGQAAGSVVLRLGFGHTRLGRAANGAGFNAYLLRTSASPWTDSGLTIHPSLDNFALASTQMHHTMEGRPLILTATLPEFEANPKFAQEATSEEDPLTLYKPYDYTGYAWGMAIDQTAVSAAMPALSRARPKTTLPSSAKNRCSAAARCTGSASISYYTGATDNPRVTYHAGTVHAVRKSAVRAGVSRSAPPCTVTRASTIWFTTAASARATAPTTAPIKCGASISSSISDWNTESLKLHEEPRCHRPHPRRYGEMHVLHSAHPRRPISPPKRQDRTVRDGEVHDRVPAGMPNPGHCFRQHQRPE